MQEQLDLLFDPVPQYPRTPFDSEESDEPVEYDPIDIAGRYLSGGYAVPEDNSP